MYKIKILKSAQKDMKNIKDKNFLYKIHNAIISLKHNPHTGKKLKGYDSLYRIRVGKFRIVYKIDEKEKIVYVVLIDKRSRVYKRV